MVKLLLSSDTGCLRRLEHAEPAARQWATSCGTKWYKLLCENYTKVSTAYSNLRPAYQQASRRTGQQRPAL